MFGFALTLFLVLVVAATVLADEARTGRFVGTTARRSQARAAVFFGATVAGGSLLAALPASEWLLGVALLPITLVCLLRFAMLARGWWQGWRLAVLTAALVGVGIAVCRPLLPVRLSRAAILLELRPGRPAAMPDTIVPDAGFPVRV